MFPGYEDKVVDRIGLLQSQANLLLSQKKQVKKDKVLSDGYTIAIAEILSAITRLSKELATEKEPTGGN